MTIERPRHSRLASGFSLMELLVVVAILAMVVGVTSARLSSRDDTVLLKAESRKLVTHLRATRSKSLAEGRVFRVEAIESGAGYAIQPGDETVILPEKVTIKLNRQKSPIGGSRKPISIDFYPDGSSSGGTLNLSAESGGQKIAVNWMTGEVAIAPGA